MSALSRGLPPGFTANKVLLCLHLATMIYDTSYLPNAFNLIYSNTGGGENQRFFVVSHGDELFIVIRGANSAIDFRIASDFRQISFQNGLAHGGLVNSSRYVLNKTLPVVENWHGPVYFVGHSTGGGTAGLCAAALIGDRGMDNVFAVLIGPFPSVTHSVGKKYKKRILTLQNLNDAITFQTVVSMRNVTKDIVSLDSKSISDARKRISTIIGMFKKATPDASPSLVLGIEIYGPRLLEHIERSCTERYKQMYHMGQVIAFESGCEPRIVSDTRTVRNMPLISVALLPLHSVESYIDAFNQAIVNEYLAL